ncbi:hypothetical protein [Aliikangiella sp. IMCC44359]|uniref:hypothetical protein n=1 Tax=Aliikangiella sp. IMCC44359 TaxID=3459125 RepID=UPI00403AA9F1
MNRLILSAFLLFTSFHVNALKIKSHIWVAEQVFKDISDDGHVSIMVNGQITKIKLNEVIKDSIIAYPDSFYSGVIGPDAFPDVFSGQAIVHPGIRDKDSWEIEGWQTDDWMRWLINSELKVLNEVETSGKLSCGGIDLDSLDDVTNAFIEILEIDKNRELEANMTSEFKDIRDVLAQGEVPISYSESIEQEGIMSNRDCFSIKASPTTAFAYGYLLHGSMDFWAHTYVNQYSGDLFDIFDGELEVEKRHIALESLIDKHLPEAGLIKPINNIPKSFIADKLIFNEKVQEQYSKSNATVHLSSIYSLHKEIERGVNSNILSELDREVAKLLATELFGIEINSSQANRLIEIAQKINDSANDAIDIEQKLVDESAQIINEVLVENAALKIRLIEQLRNSANQYLDLKYRVTSLTNQIEQLSIDIGEKLFRKTRKKVCSKKKKYIFGSICLVHKWVEKTVYYWSDHQKQLINQKSKLKKFKNQLEIRMINRQAVNLKKTINDITKVIVETVNVSNEVYQNNINLIQRFTQDINIIRSILISWNNDIKLSMEEYVAAWGKTMFSTATHDGFTVEHLTYWKNCYMPAIIGVPSEITLTTCAVNNYVHTVNETLDSMSTYLGSPLLSVVSGAVEELEQQLLSPIYNLRDVAEAKIQEKLEEFVPDEVSEIVKVSKSELTDYEFDELFLKSYAHDEKVLLAIDNMSQRVRADMFIENNVFNSNKFPVIFNSIQMSKLTLLDKTGLNKLAKSVGFVSSPIYGTDLFKSSLNILVDAVSSIDGNHAWMEVAPEYVREESKPDNSAQAYRTFGYSSAEGKGFVFWQDPYLRENLFLKMFIGPLSPSLESPGSVNMQSVLPNSYPYRGCKDNPYPIEDVVYSCGARIGDWLPSVLHLLL